MHNINFCPNQQQQQQKKKNYKKYPNMTLVLCTWRTTNLRLDKAQNRNRTAAARNFAACGM